MKSFCPLTCYSAFHLKLGVHFYWRLGCRPGWNHCGRRSQKFKWELWSGEGFRVNSSRTWVISTLSYAKDKRWSNTVRKMGRWPTSPSEDRSWIQWAACRLGGAIVVKTGSFERVVLVLVQLFCCTAVIWLGWMMMNENPLGCLRFNSSPFFSLGLGFISIWNAQVKWERSYM